MWRGAKYKHTEPVTNIDEKSSDRVPLFLSHRIHYDFDFEMQYSLRKRCELFADLHYATAQIIKK